MTKKGAASAPRKGIPTALVGVLAGAMILGAVILRVFVDDWASQRKVYAWKRTNVFKIWVALQQYSREHRGVYPYDPDGPDRALYLLKPYVKRARVFDSDSADKDINGRARWDDRNKRLVGGDYDYINWPDLWGGMQWRYLVVIAEKTGVKAGGKAYVTLGGGPPGLYVYGPDLPKDIVGSMLFPVSDP